MTDAREARRAAEKAARDRLAGPLISSAGELGVAVAGRQAAATAVEQAQQRAREHVRRAQQETEQIVSDACAQVAAADDEYRRAHRAALAAGWSAGALHDMGYPAPPTPRRHRTTPAPAKAAPTGTSRPDPTSAVDAQVA